MYAKSFDNQTLATIRQWVAEAERIVLLAHLNADGDACGSLLGCTLLMDKYAVKARSIIPILPTGCPENFRWLPDADRILSANATAERIIAEADLIVNLDHNTPDRIEPLTETFKSAKGHKLLVDHHHSPATDQYDVIVSDDSISSTCELMHWLAQALWGADCHTRDSAICLYTGLRTDTGGFAFSCSQPSCFEAAAGLVALDIDPAGIHNRINNNFSIDRMKFYGFALSHRLHIHPQERVAFFALSKEDLESHNVNVDDLEGLVNYTLMMKEIDTGALLREDEDGKVKVSLRTKGEKPMHLIAKQHGGGGHPKAAGFNLHCSLREAVATVEKLLLVFCFLFFAACGDRTPIIEVDNRNGDPLKENMINANKIVAQSETTQINAYLDRHGWNATPLPCGAHYEITAAGNGVAIAPDDRVVVTYRLEALDGTPFYTHQVDTLTVGRREQTLALDGVLQRMEYHAKARIVAPSGAAYGATGDGDRVGSRTVIVYLIEDINKQ